MPELRTDDEQLLAQYRATRSRGARNRIVERNLHLADYHVKRYSRAGLCSSEDLRQSALLAIVKAVERFDPSHGASFRTFASRTVDGELKRYLRDRTWTVRPPRRAQELYLKLRRAGEELGHALGRAPTVAELASRLDVDEDTVLLGLESGRARVADRLDVPRADGSPASRLDRELGDADPTLDEVETRLVLSDALAGLDERARLVVRLRFFEDLSQPEIAEVIGVSQSYVSRILRESMVDLRARMVGSAAG